MYDNELYAHIYKGDIQNSIYISTKLILDDPLNKNIELLENTFIAICSYIGTFISILDIKLWILVIYDIYDFINDSKIVIKNIYLIITKLCIICNIYITNPVSKSGIIKITSLREKIISLFSNNNKLSYYYIKKFDEIIPPNDSETYDISLIIIKGITDLINECDELSDDNANIIINNANKIRDCFDYFSRKKYIFETKFHCSDNDSIWFLWGLLKILYDVEFIDIGYKLFVCNYNKRLKTERLGILWGLSVSIIYIIKKDISRSWNSKELNVINKIDDISIQLYNEIKKDLNSKNIIDNTSVPTNNNTNGLDYLITYRPAIIKNNNLLYDNINNNNDDIVKKIKYNKNKK